MSGAAKHKVVTSGRLTGGAKVQLARKPVAPNPAAAARSEPTYSLYSTDSEDQVTTLHKGLDRCAALLSGILQAEKTASPSFPRAATGRVSKSRPATSLGKKSIKKLPTKTAVQKSSQSDQCGPSTTSLRTSHRSPAPAAHAGVKLHPPRKHPHSQLQSHQRPPPRSKTLSPTNPPPQSQPSILLSVVQSSPDSGRLSVRQCEGDTVRPSNAECDFVPVRDVNAQSSVTDTHRSPNLHTCSLKMLDTQLDPGQSSRKNCGTETDVKVKTVQYLLEELKALIAGQGSVAEMLLSYLEQAVSSPQMKDGSSIIQAGPELSSLHSQNTLLHRCVSVLEQQLKETETAETQQNTETLSNSEVLTLQEELTTAQSRVQELQDDLTELRKALQDTQRQLSERQAENIAIKTDLETTRSRLAESEREKSEMAAVAQQRLEEMENLNRILQNQDSSDCATVVGSVSDTSSTIHQHRDHPAGPPADHITQYLMSLDQLNPIEHVCVAAEREGNAESARRRLLDSTLSHCDVESVRSDWSVRSESTFNTRDEAAFRDGLAALDASIASLQKTIQLDLRR